MKVEGRVIGTQDVVISSQSGDEEGDWGERQFFFEGGGEGEGVQETNRYIRSLSLVVTRFSIQFNKYWHG